MCCQIWGPHFPANLLPFPWVLVPAVRGFICKAIFSHQSGVVSVCPLSPSAYSSSLSSPPWGEVEINGPELDDLLRQIQWRAPSPDISWAQQWNGPGPEHMSERMSEYMSGRMANRMAERLLEHMPDRTPEGISDVSEYMPDRMPERMSKYMPDSIPNRCQINLECQDACQIECQTECMPCFLADAMCQKLCVSHLLGGSFPTTSW